MRIRSFLYDLAISGEIDDPALRGLAWWEWDALDLADAGIILQTRDYLVAQMRQVLAEATACESPWATRPA